MKITQEQRDKIVFVARMMGYKIEEKENKRIVFRAYVRGYGYIFVGQICDLGASFENGYLRCGDGFAEAEEKFTKLANLILEEPNVTGNKANA